MATSALLAKSAGDKTIPYFSFGDRHRPCFILIGGVHGDEPEGAKLVEDFKIEVGKIESKLKTHTVVIPRYNPDGLDRNERTNENGVDLNRNFPSSDWDSTMKAPRYNPGPSPSSEPETQGLVKLLEELNPFLVVHCHTYIPQVCYTGEKSARWAKILAKNFSHPVTEDIGYPTPGSLGQYCLLSLDTACVCIELPEGILAKNAWTMLGDALLEIAVYGP